MMKFMLYTTDHQLIQRAVPRGLRLGHILNEEIMTFTLNQIGTAVAQWLRCCATNRKVAGSIPDGVIGIFH